ncbi:ras-related C3 botulinum toxin substrate 2, partial [Flagelloscypha sp. PMI_526]
FPQKDVFLLCFSVDYPWNLDELDDWNERVNRKCPGAPKVLVAFKTDLRHNDAHIKRLKERRMEPITSRAIREYAKQIGAVSYIECCALNPENVRAVFDEAIRVACELCFRVVQFQCS